MAESILHLTQPEFPINQEEAHANAAAERFADLRAVDDLLQWIESARHITHVVSWLAQADEAFRRRLADNDVVAAGGEWSACESEALQSLIALRRRLTSDAEAALRAVAQ